MGGCQLGTTGGRYPPFRVYGLGCLALVEAWVGSPRAATEYSDEALEIAREASLLSHTSTTDAFLARALVAIQRGEPETGAISLHEGSLRAAANQRPQLMWIAHLASKVIDPTGTDLTAIEPTGTPPPIVELGLAAIRHKVARQAGEPHTDPAAARMVDARVRRDRRAADRRERRGRQAAPGADTVPARPSRTLIEALPGCLTTPQRRGAGGETREPIAFGRPDRTTHVS